MRRAADDRAGFESARAATLARRYLASRRRRSETMYPGLFADPAWDMLLDLFAARIEGRQISVSSACIASGVPSTTALRCVNELERLRLIVRSPDERDRRRSFVQISDEASIEMERWLNATFVN